jgi:hypothetical protein
VNEFFDRFRHGRTAGDEAADHTIVAIDASSLSRVFSALMWLRDLGLLSWFLVGLGFVLVGVVSLLGLTSTITEPVLVGAILATVAGPLVTRMQRRRIPRAAGAAIVLLGLIGLGIDGRPALVKGAPRCQALRPAHTSSTSAA